MARPVIRNDIETYPVINFKPTADTWNVCSFQDKFSFANIGLSGAYKALFTPVPKISNENSPGTDSLVTNAYRAYDPERDTYGNVYNSKEPKPEPNWFSNLNPYDPVTKQYKIAPNMANTIKTIEAKYYPNGVPSPHPAFDPYFDRFGGSRSGNIVPVIDINPKIPPFMNMYFHMKAISNQIKDDGSKLVQSQLPLGIESFADATQKMKSTPARTVTI